MSNSRRRRTVKDRQCGEPTYLVSNWLVEQVVGAGQAAYISISHQLVAAQRSDF